LVGLKIYNLGFSKIKIFLSVDGEFLST
jgi:hypothetical protein